MNNENTSEFSTLNVEQLFDELKKKGIDDQVLEIFKSKYITRIFFTLIP